MTNERACNWVDLLQISSVQFSPENTAGTGFYPRDAMPAPVLAMALCPCLSVSVTSRCCSIERVERIGLVLARELLSTCPTLCCKKTQVPLNVKVLPSGTLLQTPLLSARPAVNAATLKRAATNFAAW